MPFAGDMLERFETFAAALPRAGQTLSWPIVPDGAVSLLTLAAALRHNRPVVVVTDGPHALEACHQDLVTLHGAVADAQAARDRIRFLPAWETLPGDDGHIDPDIAGLRLASLLALSQYRPAEPAFVLATSIQAIMQRCLSPESLAGHTLNFRRGDEADLTATLERLDALGYLVAPEVQQKGQVSVKGGLLDVWPTSALWPLRLEFFGEELESIRTFDPWSQRSLHRFDRAVLPPVHEHVGAAAAQASTVAAYVPPDALIVWRDRDSIAEHAAELLQRARESKHDDRIVPGQVITEALNRGRAAIVFEAAAQTPDAIPAVTAPDALLAATPHASPDGQEAQRARWVERLRALARTGYRVGIAFDTQGALDHFSQTYGKPARAIATLLGRLSEGFVVHDLRLVLLSEADLNRQRKLSGQRYDPLGDVPRPRRDSGDRVADLAALEPGELVVHVAHGLGRYLGLNEIVFDGQRQEVITIEYADDAKLHVPAAHAHLLTRYVGVSRRSAALHRLGGKRWEREKVDAEQAIRDMAASLLDTQAQRSLLEGFAFPPDTAWQREFEASFPYHETPDQHRVIAEVKRDMQSSQPMDRLICGDAGYGKTEVAMRAALKCVEAGKQAAVLVPTTVLAQQHYQTFCERMAAYPVRIEVISRFRSQAQRAAILAGLLNGDIDIVIGTHALVQPSVRFKNLGLAIIDEEQRFGVKHKERLKQIRRMVDVLTLTATPIPRTLYMSMTGARDMSLLQTPPRERMAIETIVAKNTDATVREAILRELNREGQVFYLHNRVMTIDRMQERLREVIPEARIATAHGQMPAGQLKAVMQRFVAGEFDVLLCTTIIESGMDIPRANTILIDRADRFGIADLYQLRGRVGRSNHRAYAYLLLPPHGHVDRDARRRIGAVKKFSALGAGFHLALRDLEIRGAGNLLGARQSGHITAIGFGLYCQLLQRTVARLQGKPLPPVIDVEVHLDFLDLSPAGTAEDAACIPYSYIDDEPQRLQVYRKLAQVVALGDVTALRDELTDRFGPPPPPVAHLLAIAALRLAAYEQRLTGVRVKQGKLLLTRNGSLLTQQSRFPRLAAQSPTERLREIMQRVQTCDAWSGA